MSDQRTNDLAEVAEGLMFMLSDAGHRIHALKGVLAMRPSDDGAEAETELARLRIVMGKLSALQPPEVQGNIAAMLKGERSVDEPLQEEV